MSGNSGRDIGWGTEITTRPLEMARYNDLPPAVRVMIANGVINYSASAAWEALTFGGLHESVVCAELARGDYVARLRMQLEVLEIMEDAPFRERFRANLLASARRL